MNKSLAAVILSAWVTIAFAGTISTDPAIRFTGFKSRVGTYTLDDKPEYWKFDLRNRAEAQDAYWTIYAENAKVPFSWTGDAASLKPGETSAAWRAALLRAFNYQRYYFYGQEFVVFVEESNTPAVNFGRNTDGSATGKTTREAAQAGATVLAANKVIRHDLTGLSGMSDLAQIGSNGDLTNASGSASNIIEAFLVDPGSNNTLLGHRSSFLDLTPLMDVGTALNGTYYATSLFHNTLSGYWDAFRGS